MSEFHKGVRAFFNHLTYRAANHWHEDPHVNEKCQEENDLIINWACDALGEIDEKSLSEWSDISDLTRQRDRLLDAMRQTLAMLRTTSDGQSAANKAEDMLHAAICSLGSDHFPDAAKMVVTSNSQV